LRLMNGRCLLMALWLVAFAPVAAVAAVPEGATEVRLVTWPSLSPDGEMVVFEWLNQLWTAPSGGGEARRLTHDAARDSHPVFTPDGGRVVFSSERSGSLQVHSIPVAGGEAVRHSHHTEGNAVECVSPDGTRALVRGMREHAGSRQMRLMEIDLTADRRERRLFDAAGHSAAWSPDGGRVLFCRGGEQLFRKGYDGARASQLWLFDQAGGTFERLLADEAEVRSPRWHADGRGFFHVSPRGGTANLCSWRWGAGKSEQLTFFEGDGVILRDVSADGSTLLLRRSWQVLRFRPGVDAAPLAVGFWTREDVPAVARKVERVRGTNHADFGPLAGELVMAAGGDLWRLPPGEDRPVRLTRTVAEESEPRFSPDGERLFFLRDDGLEANYVSARWHDGTLADEVAVTRGPGVKSRLKVSPDGRRLAWLEGNGDLFSALADGSEARLMFPCWDPPTFDWSPDGRWLAVAAKDRNSNRDIWLVAADGSREPLNLTADPAFEGSPRWSPDGRFLVFTARRNAARTAELWRIDFGADGLAAEPAALDEARVMRAAAGARPVGSGGIEPARVIWQADSRSLLFQNADAGDPWLYRLDAVSGAVEPVIEQRGVPIRLAADGALLWRVDRTPAVLRDGRLTSFPFSLQIRRERADLSRLGFRRIWRTLGERFYDPAMNGSDWPAMLETYEPLAVAARDSRQFDRVVGHLLGELNASHLTFVTRPWPPGRAPDRTEPATAHPGVFFEEPTGGGGPLRVRGVLAGSPAALADHPPQPGETVFSIGGMPVTEDSPMQRLFNGAAGRWLPFVLRGADGAERTVRVECLPYGRVRELVSEARLAARRELAGEDVAYLALPRMGWDDLAVFERDLYRASLERSGLVLDLRDNGGGQVADHLLAMFTQPVHAFTIPRGGPRGYPHDRRIRAAWDKPLVVLCNENTYSNAEIFCHAVKLAGRAPLVGIETAGGVISAVKVPIPEVGTLQVPFRGWYHAGTGEDLDRNGARPDHEVPLGPAGEVAGEDPQLRLALRLLREQVREQPGPVAPRRRGD